MSETTTVTEIAPETTTPAAETNGHAEIAKKPAKKKSGKKSTTKVKAAKKPAKKPTVKKAEKKADEPKRYRKIKSDLSGGTKKGSTRSRIFKALYGLQENDALTAGEIKKKCGLPDNSGHLGVLLAEEVRRGRLRKCVAFRGSDDRYIGYYLSALGTRDFDAGTIDGSNYAGNRINVPWTKKRRKAEQSA